MALQDIGRIQWPKLIMSEISQINAGNSASITNYINFSNTVLGAAILQAENTITITQISFYVNNVASSGIITVTVESVDAATQRPSGTRYATNSYADTATLTSANNASWVSVTLNAPVTITKGSIYAITFRRLSGPTTVAVNLSGRAIDVADTCVTGSKFPATYDWSSGTGWRYRAMKLCLSINTTTGFIYNSGITSFNPAFVNDYIDDAETRDGSGIELTVPFACRVNGVKACITGVNNSLYEILVFVNDFQTPVISFDFELIAMASGGIAEILFPSNIVVNAGDVILISFNLIAGSSARLISSVISNSLKRSAVEGGLFVRRAFYNGLVLGVRQWTYSDLHYPNIHLMIDQLDDGVIPTPEPGSNYIPPTGEILMRDSYNITTGDDFLLQLTLTENEITPTAIDLTGATIQVAVISKNFSERYSTPVALNSAALGADWANGIIIINIPQTVTVEIDTYIYGNCNGWLEIEVTRGAIVQTWYQAVTIKQGHVGTVGGE